MNHSILRFFTGLAAVVLFSQCAVGPQSRIERNPQMFNQLSSRERELVTSGVIREGMNRDAVFLAWGRPDQVSVGTSRGKEIESWTYLGERPVRSYNMNMGFGFGGWGYGGCGPYGWGGGYPYMGGGPSVMYVPYTAGVVEFTRGRVTHWSASPR